MMDSGNTAWLLTSAALVMLMTAPGLALFYGGLVGRRNVLSTLMHSFFALLLVSLQWVLWGYTLAFGPDVGGWRGGLEHLWLRGVGGEALAPYGVPHLAFAMFQGMFAVITAALISGAYAERMAFPAFALFTLLWSTLVYAPLAHWVWGGGWLARLGALDFAGGTVVHISSGVSALVASWLVGPRAGYPERVSRPHNIPFTVLGASLLWFGWFGFNAGSALTSGALAAWAFAVTHVAAAAAGLTWTALEWARRGAPSLVGGASGAVAGLVAITPASGYVGIPAAMAIGAGAGMVCYLAVTALKPRLGYDDSLDVFGVHGVAGTWGALATGVFASRVINPAGADGLLSGNPAQLVAQLWSVAAAWVLAGAGTFLLLKLVAAVTPLRVTREQELQGLDAVLHGETAYDDGLAALTFHPGPAVVQAAGGTAPATRWAWPATPSTPRARPGERDPR